MFGTERVSEIILPFDAVSAFSPATHAIIGEGSSFAVLLCQFGFVATHDSLRFRVVSERTESDYREPPHNASPLRRFPTCPMRAAPPPPPLWSHHVRH